MPQLNTSAAAIAWLRTPEAVRERCETVFAVATENALDHFALDLDRLDATAAYVVETINDAYPTLNIPYHARWRHFAVGGVDRWGQLAADGCAQIARDEVARVRFDLVVTSVLLDAGSGPDWSYYEAETGATLARSEGLGVASLRLFAKGGFSADTANPLRADAEKLTTFADHELADGFQVSADNPLAGIEGRAELMRRLGAAVAAGPEFFGAAAPRVGNLYDHLIGQAENGALPAAAILRAVLYAFSTLWPGRIALDGVNLGDTWQHPAIRTNDTTDQLVPFHKLSQWLSYSLIEPLEEAGISVTAVDALTGLPEYRNGGLLLDCGVLVPKHSAVLGTRLAPGDEIVVEWRALTVALLDRLAERVRGRLGLDAMALPLAKILEGGTWAAGRRIAAEQRAGGGPPLQIESDGTVF